MRFGDTPTNETSWTNAQGLPGLAPSAFGGPMGVMNNNNGSSHKSSRSSSGDNSSSGSSRSSRNTRHGGGPFGSPSPGAQSTPGGNTSNLHPNANATMVIDDDGDMDVDPGD